MEGLVKDRYRSWQFLSVVSFCLVILVTAGWGQDADPQPQPQELTLEQHMDEPITFSCADTSIDLVLFQLADLANVNFIKSKNVCAT